MNLIKEYRNYVWMTDKEGKIINEPEGGFDHALDAIKYGIVSLTRSHSTGVNVNKPIYSGYNQLYKPEVDMTGKKRNIISVAYRQ